MVKVYFPKYSREEIIEILRQRLQILLRELPLRLLILFGSYAKNQYTVASDIDLLIVYDGPKRKEAYGLAWDIINLPQLQLHIYTTSEYEELKKSGSSFPKEAEKGIIIWKKA
jgi:hypothetical protein